MSPVVTINSVLALAEKGYGEDKGLASILCTAACMDNVHIVSIFVICYSIVFPNGKRVSFRILLRTAEKFSYF